MAERFPYVAWWCDRCGANLNIQSGFDEAPLVIADSQEVVPSGTISASGNMGERLRTIITEKSEKVHFSALALRSNIAHRAHFASRRPVRKSYLMSALAQHSTMPRMFRFFGHQIC